MFGNGVWTYITSPTTSGEPSWPRSTPVEKVQATCSLLTLPALILVELRVAARIGVVDGLEDLLGRVGRALQDVFVRQRRDGAEDTRAHRKEMDRSHGFLRQVH